MPVYLVHGFRWPRGGLTGIRIWSIMHNLENCSAEYIQNPGSARDILSSFHKEFPDIMRVLEGPARGLVFIEQYDPEDEMSENAVSQPYAFVGDRVITIADKPKAGVDVAIMQQHHQQQQSQPRSPTSPPSRAAAAVKAAIDKRANGPPGAAPNIAAATLGSALSVNFDEATKAVPVLSSREWEALADLRDKIAGENEKIGWWIVSNGDPDRTYDTTLEDNSDEESDGSALTPTVTTPTSPLWKHTVVNSPSTQQQQVLYRQPQQSLQQQRSHHPLPPPPLQKPLVGPPPVPRVPASALRDSSRPRTASGKEKEKEEKKRAPSKTRPFSKTERDKSEEPQRPKTPREAVKKFFSKR